MSDLSPCQNGLLIILDRLKDAMFSSRAVVDIDSILVSSLFGQRVNKKAKRVHRMQTLSRECVVDEETRAKIYDTFEEDKEKLSFGNPAAYLDTAKNMAGALYRGCSLLKSAGAESKGVIEWCISAYSMVINPESRVKLSCIGMGPNETLGFAVHALVAIPRGTDLYELVGLMPKDNKAKHSEVSSIKPTHDQNQSHRVERILFGPLRFLNHVCDAPNAEFIAIAGSSAFYAVAIQDITPGEELLVDYGNEWFRNEPGGCPCQTCKPDQQAKKRQMDDKDDATIQAERREARKAKCKRTKERKRAIKNNKEEFTEGTSKGADADESN